MPLLRFFVVLQTQKATGRLVAIKKIAMKRGKYTEGANFTALREIKLLQELKHEHIIEVSSAAGYRTVAKPRIRR